MEEEVRQITKTVRVATIERLAHRPQTTDERTLLSSMCLCAIQRLEAACTADVMSEEDEQTCKRMRKLLRRLEKSDVLVPSDKNEINEEATSASPPGQLNLGQYAEAKAFDGDEKKTSKFARLMGGGKGTKTSSQHDTRAASATELKTVESQLLNQFEQGTYYKSKKRGLGA